METVFPAIQTDYNLIHLKRMAPASEFQGTAHSSCMACYWYRTFRSELTTLSRTKLVLHIIITSIQQSLCVCQFCNCCLVLAWTQGPIFLHNGQTLCCDDLLVSTKTGPITCFPVLVLAGTQLSVRIEVVRNSTTIIKGTVLLLPPQHHLASQSNTALSRDM